MERTGEKLREARFFLQRLEASYLEYPDFDYYLSAFISSARSVLWVMRNEYGRVRGWECWYTGKKPTVKEQQFLKGINAVRVRSEKKEPIKTEVQATIVIPPEQATPELEQALNQFVGEPVNLAIKLLSDKALTDMVKDSEALTFVGTLEQVHQVLREFPEEDALDVCRQYYSMLQDVVTECERLFS